VVCMRKLASKRTVVGNRSGLVDLPPAVEVFLVVKGAIRIERRKMAWLVVDAGV
jgi:hypothetical protein